MEPSGKTIAVIPAALRPLALAAMIFIVFAACQSRDAALYDTAEKLWLNDKHREAVTKLELLVTEYPDSKKSIDALFRLGEIHYLNLDEPAKALDYFIKVTKTSDKSELSLKTHVYIAEIYERSLQNYDLAILQYQRILNDFPGLVDPAMYHFKIGMAYFSKGAYDQAIIEFQTMLGEFQGNEYVLDAKYQIANCTFIMGKSEQALEQFKILLKDYPSNKYEYDIKLGMGGSYEEMDKLKDALETYEGMMEDFPERELVARKIDSVTRRMESRKRK